jgi:hypothetical protein
MTMLLITVPKFFELILSQIKYAHFTMLPVPLCTIQLFYHSLSKSLYLITRFSAVHRKPHLRGIQESRNQNNEDL